MSNPEEQELERLLKAAYPPEVRPNPAARRQALNAMRALRSAPFPNAVLAALGALVLALAVWLGVSLLGALPPAPGFEAVALLVGANLLLSPAAALVIIIRRKHGTSN